MKSLTYELTTVYADQIVNSIQSKQAQKDKMDAIEFNNGGYKPPSKHILNRIRKERNGDRLEWEMRHRDKPLPGYSHHHAMMNHNSTKQMVRELQIDKELYFERHMNVHG